MPRLIVLTLEFQDGDGWLRIDVPGNTDIASKLPDPMPARGVVGSKPGLEGVWLVGKMAEKFGDELDPSWRQISIQPRSVGELMASCPEGAPSEEALLASGLVLTAFAEIGETIGQPTDLDLVFYCDGWVCNSKMPKAAPPWLVYALRRLGLRGRVAACNEDEVDDGWKDPNNREGFFKKPARDIYWCELSDIVCPVDIVRVELFKTSAERPSQTWHAVRAGASLPLNTGNSLNLRDKADLVTVDWFHCDAPNQVEKDKEAFKLVKRRKIGPWAEDPKPCLLISIKSFQTSHTQLPNGAAPSSGVYFDKTQLSRVNPFDGISQGIEIDRFGRMLLLHLDDADRALPVWKPDRVKAVTAIDLGNLLFPGLAFDYPTQLGRTSYNGGPVQLGLSDRQVEIGSFEKTNFASVNDINPGRAINNRVNQYRSAVDAVREARDVDYALSRIRWDFSHCAGLKADLNAARAEEERMRSRSFLNWLASRSEDGDWNSRREAIVRRHEALLETLAQTQIEAVLTLVPPEMPELKAAIENINVSLEIRKV